MLAAFAEIAELERGTIVSRVSAGLIAAKSRGVALGRPKKHDDQHVRAIKKLREEGVSFDAIAEGLGLSKTTVQRLIRGRGVV